MGDVQREDKAIFIPHGQTCEAHVFIADDIGGPCGAPAHRHVLSQVGAAKYVCIHHGNELPDAGW